MPNDFYTEPVSEPARIVVRFGPWSADACRISAVDQHDDDLSLDRDGRYGISVFCDYVLPDEDVDTVVERICVDAPCGGRKIAVVWAAELELGGWVLEPDPPPDMHYLIGQGDFSQVPDVESLESIWLMNKQNNPAHRK